MANEYTIQQASKMTQVSAHTLRYYEREGLLNVARTSSGHRRYTDDDIGWIRFIMLLKSTNMPLAEIAQFVKLEKDGHRTIEKRRTMLEDHRETLTAHIAQLQNYMKALDEKIVYYSEVNDALLDCVTNTPESNGVASCDDNYLP
ncbi:MAG: MerR family transcriptional regulator [Chloroflexota bacterium]